jgi:catechol 2,3-dioxygenase-like lactoylglutathione lyase family enzyme
MSPRPNVNPLVPELLCTDIKASIAFYCGVLGFHILYERPEKGFAMVERQGSQIMLDQYRPDDERSWRAAPMERPFGRGMNLEIGTEKIDDLYTATQSHSASIFLPIEERWYRADDLDLGVRQFIVLDPDGYLLRFSQEMGTRAAKI